MMEQLKAFNAARADLESMVGMAAYAKLCAEQFKAHGLNVPEWLDNTTTLLDTEIKAKARDELLAKLKKAELTRETLLTPGERRAKLDGDIETLRVKLGLSPAPASTAPQGA